jgi:hypothetical protein
MALDLELSDAWWWRAVGGVVVLRWIPMFHWLIYTLHVLPPSLLSHAF